MGANRYLKKQRRLTRMALEQLVAEDEADLDSKDVIQAQEEEAIAAKVISMRSHLPRSSTPKFFVRLCMCLFGLRYNPHE
jgi:hypothetical protein